MDFMKNKIIALALCLATAMTVFSFGSVANAVTTEKKETYANLKSPSDFSWDNASVYFLMTDRFYNGNTSNDSSYKRSKKGNNSHGAFHGGDFAGITKKINEGYFDKLGVNALWISAPYEQIHGYCNAGQGKSGSFPHYSYHGYYALDFSQTDANFGTEKEFETLVDTAHKKGIRIVLDIVMNHVGYNNYADMSEYGYGTLKPGWEDSYWNAKFNDITYHNYIDYHGNAADWAKWWGSDWLRADLAGYREDGGGELTGCQSFLPDVRTESTKTVDIPQILKTKWNKEKTMSQKQQELNAYFTKFKAPKTVRHYMVAWLSSWVEKYGVDGFRCDTAKHVEMDSWVALKKACVENLKTWRKNNPTKPGANWDEDFWMTGECYPHYLSYDNYYTSGAFDSMINFSFQTDHPWDGSGRGVPDKGSINNTYADYAGQLNNNDKYNVLSYISSHDTALCRNNLMYQGSAFQLLPGAIQIFYGDESNRPLAGAYQDHNLRKDMNFNVSGNDQKILEHWQKVGKFRSNHVAVGAGQHKSLPNLGGGTAFARTYNKNGVKDNVVCVIAASANTNVSIPVKDYFADNTVVRNAYDGKTAKVSGGSVSFNSGANGTILVELNASPDEQSTEETTQTPDTATTPITTHPTPSGLIYGDSDLDKRVSIKDATLIQEHAASLKTLTGNALAVSDVNSDGNVNVKDATCIQCFLANLQGSGKTNQSYGGGSVTPTAAPTQEETDPPTDPEPETDPEIDDHIDGTRVYFANDRNWDTPHAYVWKDGGGSEKAPWPGEAMQQDSNGKWYFDVPEGFDKIIFNVGSNSDQTGDLSVPSESGKTLDCNGNES
jgi:alpha-amylase